MCVCVCLLLLLLPSSSSQLERDGGIISAAGLVMAIAFGGLLFSSVLVVNGLSFLLGHRCIVRYAYHAMLVHTSCHGTAGSY